MDNILKYRWLDPLHHDNSTINNRSLACYKKSKSWAMRSCEGLRRFSNPKSCGIPKVLIKVLHLLLNLTFNSCIVLCSFLRTVSCSRSLELLSSIVSSWAATIDLSLAISASFIRPASRACSRFSCSTNKVWGHHKHGKYQTFKSLFIEKLMHSKIKSPSDDCFLTRNSNFFWPYHCCKF